MAADAEGQDGVKCECFDLIDAALAEKNCRLVRGFNFTSGQSLAVIETEPIEKKRGQKTPVLLAKYCPFCGERTDARPEEENAMTRTEK